MANYQSRLTELLEWMEERKKDKPLEGEELKKFCTDLQNKIDKEFSFELSDNKNIIAYGGAIGDIDAWNPRKYLKVVDGVTSVGVRSLPLRCRYLAR